MIVRNILPDFPSKGKQTILNIKNQRKLGQDKRFIDQNKIENTRTDGLWNTMVVPN